MNGKEKLISISALIFVGAVLFVPYSGAEQYTEKEYYTVSKPYTETEFYTVSEPYTDIEYYTVSEPYITQVSVSYQEPIYEVRYYGRLTDNGLTNVYWDFTGATSWEKSYTGRDSWGNDEYTFYINYGSSYNYLYNINSWNIDYSSILTGYETKYKINTVTNYRDVQKSKDVTKYKEVSKSRDVTKYRDFSGLRDVIKTRDVTKSLFQRIFW